MSAHELDCDVSTPYCATISENATNNNNSCSSSSINGSPAPNTHNDSGHYSSCSASDVAIPAPNKKLTYQRYHNLLRIKDQALFTALQDLRKLRGKLDRLAKSEEWYKQELRSQKYAHAEVVERLQDQERKSAEETRQLQLECARMYEICSDLRRELEAKHDRSVQELTEAAAQANSTDGQENYLKEQIRDQLALIDVLRQQKKKLVEDMELLTEEKDTTELRLQGTLAAVQMEKATLKRNYHQMADHYNEWEQRFSLQSERLQSGAEENDKLHRLIEHLMEQLKVQQELVAAKETECRALQQKCRAQVQQHLDNVNNNEDDANRVAFREELAKKTDEIKTLRSSLAALQEELIALGNLQTQREQQDLIIDSLNSSLETHLFELDSLTDRDEPPAQPPEQCVEHERILEQLQRNRMSMRETLDELIAENNQYASSCGMCETARYDLQIREIELDKLSYLTPNDEAGVEQLRRLLHMYLNERSASGERMEVLKQLLATQEEERADLLERLAALEELTNEPDERADLQTPPAALVGGLQSEVAKLQRVNRHLMEELYNLKDIIQGSNSMIEELQSHDKQQTQVLRQKTDECDQLIEQLTEKSTALNKALFDNFMMKCAEDEAIDGKEAAHEKCSQLKSELQDLRANKQRVVDQLNCTKRRVSELRKAQKAQNGVLRDPVKLLQCLRRNPVMLEVVQREIAAWDERTPVTNASELVYLREEVKSLHLKLVQAKADSVKDQVKHVVQLKQLLQQSEARETELQGSQTQWEEMVGALQVSRDREEHLRKELALKQREFEHLNELFAIQNEQLRQLQDCPVAAPDAQQTFQTAVDVAMALATGPDVNSARLDAAMAELLNTQVQFQEMCEKYMTRSKRMQKDGEPLEKSPEELSNLSAVCEQVSQADGGQQSPPIGNGVAPNVDPLDQSIDQLCEDLQLVLLEESN